MFGLMCNMSDLTISPPASGGSVSIGGTVTSGTDNSVLFINPAATLDESASFTYDDSTTRLAVPNITSGSSASGILTLTSTTSGTKGSIQIDDQTNIWGSLTTASSTDVFKIMPAATVTHSAGTTNWMRITPTVTMSGAAVITRVLMVDGTWTQSGASFGVFNMFYSAATFTTSDGNAPPAPLVFYNQTAYTIQHNIGTTTYTPTGFVDQQSFNATTSSANVNLNSSMISFSSVPAIQVTDAAAVLSLTTRTALNIADIAYTSTGSLTVTNNIGIKIADMVVGVSGNRTTTNVYGINSALTSGTNRYFIFSDGTAQSYHAGNFRVGKASSATSELQFANASNSNIVSIKASTSTSGSYTLTLPVDDGTANQVLKTDGSGVLSWTTAAGSSPLTTKGDIFTYSTADDRLAVGTNRKILEADSTAATGLKWGNNCGFEIAGSTGTVAGTATTTLNMEALATCEYVMPFAGEVYAMSMGHSANRTAGTCTARFRLNGTANATNTVVIDGTNVRRFYRLFTTPVAFAAGDYLSLETVTAAFTPTANDALVILFCRRT